jgi:5-methylcytosine-specific restriction endonuclease McrA
MDLKEVRRRMVIAMGSKCAGCGRTFDPDLLIIHHIGFDQGKPLGYLHPDRYKMLDEFRRTGKIPPDVRLLCDRCNRKRHGYRPSLTDLFGKREASNRD